MFHLFGTRHAFLTCTVADIHMTNYCVNSTRERTLLDSPWPSSLSIDVLLLRRDQKKKKKEQPSAVQLWGELGLTGSWVDTRYSVPSFHWVTRITSTAMRGPPLLLLLVPLCRAECSSLKCAKFSTPL